MVEHGNMRASDADRARVADHLRRATDEGRLLAHELDERLGQALSARTYGELDAVVADLPHEQVPAESAVTAPRRRRPGLIAMTAGAAAAAAAAVVIFLAPFTTTGVRTLRLRTPRASVPSVVVAPNTGDGVLTSPIVSPARPPAGAKSPR